VQQRRHALAVQAMHRLASRFGLAPAARDDDDFAQMVVIPVPSQDAEALHRRLCDDSRIEIPVTQHAGQTFVRLSVQGYNTAADIERLLDAPALAPA
jgi:isopenicillin-N epimerase